MKKDLWFLAFVVALAGCKSNSAQAQAEDKDPVIEGYTQYRSGMIQMNGTVEIIEAAQQEVIEIKKKLSSKHQKPLQDPLQDIINQINEAGRCLTESCEDPLSFSEYKKQPIVRQTAINTANDTIHELDATYELLELVSKEQDMSKIEELINESIESLEEAVQTLGGKLDSSSGT